MCCSARRCALSQCHCGCVCGCIDVWMNMCACICEWRCVRVYDMGICDRRRYVTYVYTFIYKIYVYVITYDIGICVYMIYVYVIYACSHIRIYGIRMYIFACICEHKCICIYNIYVCVYVHIFAGDWQGRCSTGEGCDVCLYKCSYILKHKYIRI